MMTDESSIESWQGKFQEWVDFAKPLLPQGKAKEAFAQYPWFTTEGDPFSPTREACERHPVRADYHRRLLHRR